MRVAMAQMNSRVGDFAANLAKAGEMMTRAKRDGADLVVFPEFTLIGYPPRDLLLRRDFIDASLAVRDEFTQQATGIPAIIGYAEPNPGPHGKPLRNALAVVGEGRILSRHYKQLLPTYDVFDEARYFEATPPPGATNVTTIGQTRVGITICEDIWCEPRAGGERSLYFGDPVRDLEKSGVAWVVNVSASPYAIGKPQSRPPMYARQARRLACPVVVVNQVGSHDDLIFDGNSCAFDAAGNLIAHCKEFDEDLVVVDLPTGAGQVERPAHGVESTYKALTFGIREYVRKAGFASVVIGLSGGIDSALVAVLAVHALGPKNVLGVAMPGRYSSTHSLEDATELARNLAIEFRTIPIGQLHDAYERTMPGELTGLAGENVQARIRGNILMAIANRHARLLLATGNKSELAVGYGTLYGDMAGALAPISDLTKTLVREMAAWVNEKFDGVIPPRTLHKPPSAELSPGQTDEQRLGKYELLDEIITKYVEEEQGCAQIAAGGIDAEYVRQVIRMIDSAEFKRRQAPPGLKVTRRAFGPGRPMPIVR